MEEERERLFALDAALRAEADMVLEQSGLGRIIEGAGFQPVGSYVMRTMTWRDLDYNCAVETPDWTRHWELGLRMAKSEWAWRFRCLDAYRDPRHQPDFGYYWGLQITNPRGGETWKLDLWTARPHEFERAAPNQRTWDELPNDDMRYRILAIKEKVCHLPEYRQQLLSVHIYEAVLEHDIDNLDDFRKWWITKYGQSLALGEFWYR